ncbi:unnamed protein product [Linum trigynum]|uniref:Uncharacterized protein n=1 Tax=Linum trigynum TaxID=586398 RepID=A0AAV2EEB8_9ROSI
MDCESSPTINQSANIATRGPPHTKAATTDTNLHRFTNSQPAPMPIGHASIPSPPKCARLHKPFRTAPLPAFHLKTRTAHVASHLSVNNK